MPELVYIGGGLKALDDNGRVGGYGIRFTDAERKDLDGEYFTAKTYLGARDCDGVDCLMHHMQPMKGVAKDLTDHIFAAVKATRDDIGVFVETVLDLSNEYEKNVYELVTAGKLAWSSGAPAHAVIKAKDGEIKRWLASEFSFTPTPAEPKNKVMSLKSYAEMLSGETKTPKPTKGLFEDVHTERSESIYNLTDELQCALWRAQMMDEMAEDAGVAFDFNATLDTIFAEFAARAKASLMDEDAEEDTGAGEAPLKSLANLPAGLPFAKHSETALAAVEAFTRKSTVLTEIISDWSGRFKSIQELRIKRGAVISAANKERLVEMHTHVHKVKESVSVLEDGLQHLIGQADPQTDEHMKSGPEYLAEILRMDVATA
jgi:hypothetical protein